MTACIFMSTACSLRSRALAYLSRREYSRVELRRKLASESSHTALEAALDRLQRDGFLSDARFAENLAACRAARFGAQRIVAELKQHDIDETQLTSISAQLRATEFSRAQAVWRKKYSALPTTHAERIKQARFLAMRGFAQDTIMQLLNSRVSNVNDNVQADF